MSDKLLDGENNTSATKALNRAIATGCRMLSIREHSERQLYLKLQKKKFDKNIINDCIDYLKTEGWLSNTRFCNSFIRSKADKGQGLTRIVSELEHHKIGSRTIEQQLLEEDIDWQENCYQVLKKKLLLAKHESIDIETKNRLSETFANAKERIKVENFLRYRGFSTTEISRAMKRIKECLLK